MSHTRAPHFALLIFLIYFAIFTSLASLGLAGVEMLEPGAPASLLQALLCIPVLIVLAARLELAPLAAIVFSVAIVSAPPLFEATGASLRARSANAAALKSYAEQLIDTQRNVHGGSQLGESLSKLGYVPPPEIQALRERQRAAVSAFLASSAAARVHELASKSSRYNPISGLSFQDDLLRNLPGATGPNWTYINSFLEHAARAGLNYEQKLSADEYASARAYAEAWLYGNWDAVQASLSLGAPQYSDDSGGTSEWMRMQPVALALLLGTVAAWMGREAFRRPLDVARLPGWTLEGLRAMLRRDSTAGLRVAGGLLLILGVAVLAIGLYASGVRPDKAVIRLLAGVILAGAMIVFSGLSLSEGGRMDPPRLS